MTHQATLTRPSLQNAPALAVTNSTPQKHATSEVAFPTTREVYLALSAHRRLPRPNPYEA